MAWGTCTVHSLSTRTRTAGTREAVPVLESERTRLHETRVCTDALHCVRGSLGSAKCLPPGSSARLPYVCHTHTPIQLTVTRKIVIVLRKA